MDLSKFVRLFVALACLYLAVGAGMAQANNYAPSSSSLWYKGNYVKDATQPAHLPGPKLDGPYTSAQSRIALDFARAHTRFLDWINRGGSSGAGYNTELVFFGDSMTANWRPKYPAHFGSTWSTYSTLDLSNGGDKIQHVLWRVQNGEFPEALKAKVVVLMIGTNNTTDKNTDEQKLQGIKSIITELKKDHPTTKVLVLGIPPRSTKYADAYSKRMTAKIMAMEDPPEGIYTHDMRKAFTNANDTMNKALFQADQLHFNLAGYEVFADQIKPRVANLME